MVGLAPFLAIFGIKRVSKFRRRWTDRKREAVQSSWAALLSAHGNDRMSTGVLIFRKLFTHEEHGSHVLRLFPFRNQARTLFVSAHLKLHAKLFVDTMTTLVANLHDLERVERDLRSLGARHLTYGVVLPEHFTLMGDALIAALDESDAVTLDKEERDAWIETWGFIAKEMQRGRGKGNEIGIKSPPGSAPSSRRTSMEKKRSKGQSAA
jgi:hemoglobin-like flavoprotein